MPAGVWETLSKLLCAEGIPRVVGSRCVRSTGCGVYGSGVFEVPRLNCGV